MSTSTPEQPKPIPTITMCPCESSQISHHGYDPATNTLALTFKAGGKTYHYDNVSPELYSEFANAESLGSFFYKRIKNNAKDYPYRKID